MIRLTDIREGTFRSITDRRNDVLSTDLRLPVKNKPLALLTPTAAQFVRTIPPTHNFSTYHLFLRIVAVRQIR